MHISDLGNADDPDQDYGKKDGRNERHINLLAVSFESMDDGTK